MRSIFIKMSLLSVSIILFIGMSKSPSGKVDRTAETVEIAEASAPRAETGAAAAAAESTGWTDADYDKYDYKSFENLPQANKRIDMENVDYALLHAAIFYESNRQRDKHGLQQFSHSPNLEKAAKGHSDDMVRLNFFDHTSRVAGKETMSKRLALVGIRNAFSAENIGLSFGIEYQAGKPVFNPEQNGGYFSYDYKGDPIENHTYLGFAGAVVDQWMNSPGHRANLLNPKYTFLGCGTSHYKDQSFSGMDKFKSTQNFSSIKGE